MTDRERERYENMNDRQTEREINFVSLLKRTFYITTFYIFLARFLTLVRPGSNDALFTMKMDKNQ